MWRELTEADVVGVLSEAERAGYTSAAVAPGQDVLRDAIVQVTNYCRGYIADNPENRLAEGVTLPERVHLPALHLVRNQLLTRLDMEVSKPRADEGRAAIRFLEEVAAGRVKIEQPDGATESSGAVQKIKLLSKHERLATREKLSGL